MLIPRSDTYSPNREDEVHPKTGSRDHKELEKGKAAKQAPMRAEEKADTLPRPPIERRRSRQDLPSLQTKVPRDMPPQFRRSASAYAATPTKDHDETPRPPAPRTPSNETFLSPDVVRGANSKDYFGHVSQSAPRYHAQESFGGRAAGDRNSAGGSRPGTPSSEKRNSGNFESATRSRRNTNDKLTRPQQLSEGYASRRSERHPSTHSNKSSAGSDRPHSPRSSARSNRHYYSSSEDDIADSDSEKHHRHRHHSRHKSLRAEDDHDRHLRSQSRSNQSSLEGERLKPSSRYTSPLPSPKISPSQIPTASQFERSETFPQSRDGRRPSSRPVSPLSPSQDTPRASDRLNPLDAAAPRPKSRQSNAVPIPTTKPEATAPVPHGSLPIPIPSRIDLHSPGDTRKTPSIPQFDEDKSSSARPSVSAKPNWPPPFQPPKSNLEKPIGSYRRYSEELERGSVAPLPSCPRTSFSRGRNDWLTLPKCPSFDICPSCFNAIIAPTEFRSLFVPAPRRSPDTEVLCDFGSSPWYRIAWLLTLKKRRRDLKLFYGLANISATASPCLGKHEAIRQWHSIIDPKTGTPVRNFDVCYSCVKSVETLLPPIRGIFVRTDSHAAPGASRVCDLRFDSKRFIQYFDALETTADRADDDDGLPDTRDLASLARRWSLMEECQHDTELVDRRWHIITQLPEFTVCEECFDEVVWPEVEERKAIPMTFNKTLQRIPKASCQLYSTKMRGIFRVAVDSDDYKLLASKARERKTVEMAHKANIAELKRQSKANPLAVQEIKRVTEEWRKWE